MCHMNSSFIRTDICDPTQQQGIYSNYLMYMGYTRLLRKKLCEAWTFSQAFFSLKTKIIVFYKVGIRGRHKSLKTMNTEGRTCKIFSYDFKLN